MSAQEIDDEIGRETVSQCYTSFTRQGGNVYPESETEQMLRAEIAALKSKVENLEIQEMQTREYDCEIGEKLKEARVQLKAARESRTRLTWAVRELHRELCNVLEDWTQAEATIAALENKIAALKAQLSAAIYALECVVPINGRGECFYCGVGSKPNAKGYHVDRENLWDGDQLCYNSDYYDDARAVLKGAK